MLVSSKKLAPDALVGALEGQLGTTLLVALNAMLGALPSALNAMLGASLVALDGQLSASLLALDSQLIAPVPMLVALGMVVVCCNPRENGRRSRISRI